MASRMIQNNFSGGEISPLLHGRSDLQAYYKGCAKAENFIVTKEGTLRKRNGFRVLGESRWHDPSSVRLFAYSYDRTRSGVLVLAREPGTGANAVTGLFLRKDGTAIARGLAIADGVTQDDFALIQCKQIGDQLWLSGGGVFKVLTIDDFASDSPSVSVSEWTQATRPRGPTKFSCTGYSAEGTPYDGGGETLYWYCAYVVADGVMSALSKDHAYQRKSWVAGAYTECSITIDKNQTYDYVVIGKSNGGNTNFGEICRYYPEDFGSGSTLKFTDKNVSPGDGIYLQTNVLGDDFTNPLCVDCFQQRKTFANAQGYPMTLWFSEVGNLDNFFANRPTTDADAFSPTISSTGPAFIRWIMSYQEMLVLFTEQGIFSVGFSQTQGFGSSSCRISCCSTIAASPTVAPVRCEAGIVFVAADGKTVYTIAFDLQENMLKPTNRLVLAEHLTRTSAIRGMAAQTSPENAVWCALEDGTFAVFTFERTEEVYAWSSGKVEGYDVRDVISLGSFTDYETGKTRGDMVFLMQDNSQKEPTLFLATLTDGYADLMTSSKPDVKATLVTLRAESQERTISGQKKNIKDILLRLYETGELSVAPAQGGEADELVPVRTGTEGLFTGDVKVMPRGFINESGQMTFVSANDKPCEILQIVTALEVME
jgi:hypothetical protein